jgi:hypothetical protein
LSVSFGQAHLHQVYVEMLSILGMFVDVEKSGRAARYGSNSIVDRYDRALMRGHEAPGVIPFRRD